MELTKLRQIDEARSWIVFDIFGAHAPEYRIDERNDAQETEDNWPNYVEYVCDSHELFNRHEWTEEKEK